MRVVAVDDEHLSHLSAAAQPRVDALARDVFSAEIAPGFRVEVPRRRRERVGEGAPCAFAFAFARFFFRRGGRPRDPLVHADAVRDVRVRERARRQRHDRARSRSQRDRVSVPVLGRHRVEEIFPDVRRRSDDDEDDEDDEASCRLVRARSSRARRGAVGARRGGAGDDARRADGIAWTRLASCSRRRRARVRPLARPRMAAPRRC